MNSHLGGNEFVHIQLWNQKQGGKIHENSTGGSNKKGTSHHWVNLNVTSWILIVRTPYFGVI